MPKRENAVAAGLAVAVSLFALGLLPNGGVGAQGESQGANVVAPFSTQSLEDGFPAAWKPFTFAKVARNTRFRLVRDAQRVVVQAHAEASASALMHELAVETSEFPVLRWSWKADALVATGDPSSKAGDDYALRIYVAFRLDTKRLSLLQRAKFEAARVLYGKYPPYAAINYVWDARRPVGSTYDNPYSDRVKMVVVRSDAGGSSAWMHEQRDVGQDFKRLFGEAAPAISGIAIMTDTDNTGGTLTAYYGDISLMRR